MEFETKEELFGMLHEMLEWIGPVREKIENLKCGDLLLKETMAVADVANALYDLEEALSELDRTIEV